ncbi:MAG: hypothetical protein AAGA91_10405 [Pseudomonadota bacterium]
MKYSGINRERTRSGDGHLQASGRAELSREAVSAPADKESCPRTTWAMNRARVRGVLFEVSDDDYRTLQLPCEPMEEQAVPSDLTYHDSGFEV